MKQIKSQNFFVKHSTLVKRSLYVFLLVLLAFEAINIYAQLFNNTKPVIPVQKMADQEPAQFQQGSSGQTTTRVGNSSPEPTEVWGKSRQLDEHTWTIRVGEDKHMGTPEEILAALNTYRNRHGSSSLTWDDKLANYAKERAVLFNSIKATDKHAGFNDFVNNQDGFNKLGFYALGENSSYGFHVEGVHLIEWVYAGDEPHDKNQLNPEWTHVGIGVSETGTNLIFGGRKQ